MRSLLATAQQGELVGANDKRLAYGIFRHLRHGDASEATRGSVVLLPGYSESYLKYAETIYDLNVAGFDVFALDHRGMGLSERLAADPQIVHVEDFENYVDDLETFVERIVKPRAVSPDAAPAVLAHSTGGLIAAAAMARRPALFAKAVLTAPLFDVHTGKTPEWLAYVVATVTTHIGLAQAYVPGSGPFDPTGVNAETSTFTRSAPRLASLIELWRRVPATLMSGPSNRWLLEVLRASRQRRDMAGKIKAPILLLQAGVDRFVDPAGQDEFCEAAAACRKIAFAESMHDLLFERDVVRVPAMREIIEFLD